MMHYFGGDFEKVKETEHVCLGVGGVRDNVCLVKGGGKQFFIRALGG